MSPEKFCNWLEGFLDDKVILDAASVKKLKDKLEKVVAPVNMNFPPSYDRIFVPPHCPPLTTPTITPAPFPPNTIWCSTTAANTDKE